MREQLTDLLVQTPAFSSLSDATIAALANDAADRRYRKGEWVSHYGDVWPYLFLVAEGAIVALKESAGGRSLMVEQFGAGELFWGLAFFLEDAPTPAGLQAREDSRLFLWPRERLMPIAVDHGLLSWELTTLMVRRMLRASDIMEGLAFQPVAGRLAHWLLTRYEDAPGPVSRDLTLDEIAAQVGTTREMVCRALYRFAEAGAVEINRTAFKIADADLLQGYVSEQR